MPPLSLEQYLAAKPKRLVQRVQEALAKYGSDLPRTVTDSFVKTELRSKQTVKPRPIMMVDAIRTARVGPYLAAYDEKLRGLPFVGKFMDAHQVGRWVKDHHPTHWGDFSAFDGSLGEWAFAIEAMVYKHWGMPDDLSQWIKHYQTQWSCRQAHRLNPVAFDVKGGIRQTGNPETSFGNNIVSIVIHSWVHAMYLANRLGLGSTFYEQDSTFTRLVAACQHADFLVNGDDTIQCCPDGLPSYAMAEALGMSFELHEGVEFCRARPIQVSPSCVVMVRKPEEFLVRLGFSVHAKQLNEFGRKRLMNDIAVAYSYFVSGIPVYWALVARILQLTPSGPMELAGLKTHSFTLFNWISGVVSPRAQPLLPPTRLARLSFAEQFGISIACQVRLEQSFKTLPLYGQFSDPQLDALLWERCIA